MGCILIAIISIMYYHLRLPNVLGKKSNINYNNSTSISISPLSGADDCDDDAYMDPIDTWGVDGIALVSMGYIQVSMLSMWSKKGMNPFK